jgi:hypothetical protein
MLEIDLAQCRDRLLGEPVRQVFAFVIATEVLER